MRKLVMAPLVVLWVIVIASTAVADNAPRLAFVATSEDYQSDVGALHYSHADGEIISTALRAVGFKVERLKDPSRVRFREAFTRFADSLRAAGPEAVAFFYFSGHAGDDMKNNHLLLSDRVPEIEQMTDMGEIRKKLAEKAGVRFAEIVAGLSAVPAQSRLVIIDSHLDLDEPSLLVPGQLLATQGRPGLNAADSNNFSQALSGALLTPDLDVDGIFRQVQVKVAEVTNGRQIPYFVNRLASRLILNVSSRPPEVTSEAKADEDAWLEEPMWSSVKGSRNVNLLQVYLQRFPQGRYAAEARAQIEEAQRLSEQGAVKRPIGPSRPGRRVALVIGTGNYSQTNTLKNPVNDARAVAKSLNNLGFDVVQESYDLGREAMLKALKDFGEVTKGADWIVVYYAGHGMEVKGVNYLIPTDAKLADEEDVDEEAVRMTRLLDRLKDTAGVKILILDACRDNPLATRMFRRGASRSTSSRGLAEIQAASGTLIAYATSPGDTALDGEGEHSPYVTALLGHMTAVNDVRIMFSSVYETVDGLTAGRQKPWYAAQLPGRSLVLNIK